MKNIYSSLSNHEGAKIQADFASSFMKDVFCAIHAYKLPQKTGRHKKANAIRGTNDGRTKELFRQKIRPIKGGVRTTCSNDT